MVEKINSPKQLSPDGSGRFLVMLKIIQGLMDGEKHKKISLLDVGGGSPYMTSILKEVAIPHDLTTIDILPKPKGFSGKYIQGDATKMEFDDNTFDIVVSTDVLEHIPVERKKEFVQEAIRVAKEYIIIAAPFDTDGVDYAEHLTNDFNKKLFNEGQSWLEEHFEQTKPILSAVESVVEKNGLEYEVIGTNNLYNWVLATHMNLIEAKYGLGIKKINNNNEAFNETILSSGDMVGPFYRHFVVIFKKPLSTHQRENLNKITHQKIDHTSSLKYIHTLGTIVSERISELRKDVNKGSVALARANKEIYNLQQELSIKEAIIDKYRPYMRVIDLTPKKVVKKLLKIVKR